jgi:CubicO group peptidase (beta-lactamase class C family)
MASPRLSSGAAVPLALALALSGCSAGGGDGLGHATSPQGVAQAFAPGDPGFAFRDSGRRRKIAGAFPVIDAIAADEMRRQGLPGLAVGVVVDGELAYAKGFGVADRQTGAPVTADTVYRIGSITKSFTAEALLSLRDDGMVAFDDPLARWIPEAGALVYPTRDSPPITLRHLLTHTSGLPRGAAFDARRTQRGPSEGDILRALGGLHLENPPGTHHVYSNLGFALLGQVAGRAGQAPFREVVNRRVIAPLGMTSTVWNRDAVPPGRLAVAYTKSPSGELTPIDQLPPGEDDGAGGLYSTVRDMARYVGFQLAAYPARSDPEAGPLRRSSVREAHYSGLKSGFHVRSVRAPRKGESLVEAAAQRYGYGWVDETTCELDDLVWHNGGIDGYRTDVAFLPELGVGVIVLIDLAGASPEVVVNRALVALQKTGGLSKRTPDASPAFAPVMKRFLDVQNHWDPGVYHSMLTAHREPVEVEEKAELAGYRNTHGACRGYAPLSVKSARSAILTLDCERGVLEMDVTLGPDGLIESFTGTSREVPVPPDLLRVVEPLVGLVKTWDPAVFDQHLARTPVPRAEAAKLFDDLRATHEACTVRSLAPAGATRKLALACDRGGDLTLTLAVDEAAGNAVTSYAFEGPSQGTCPVK